MATPALTNWQPISDEWVAAKASMSTEDNDSVANIGTWRENAVHVRSTLHAHGSAIERVAASVERQKGEIMAQMEARDARLSMAMEKMEAKVNALMLRVAMICGGIMALGTALPYILKAVAP